MLFSSLTFLFIFLPIVLLLYFVPIFRSDRKKEITKKNLVLCLASLVFYAWGEPIYIFLMLISICFNYLCGLDMAQLSNSARRRRNVLVLAIVFNLLNLGFFKYSGFFAGNLAALFHKELTYTPLALPIGISFYTFQAMSYVIDVYRRKARAQRRLLSFALYISMFPQLIAGPIVQYSDIEKQLVHRAVNVKKFSVGILFFVRGLGKKVIFANTIGGLYSDILSVGAKNVTGTAAWLAVFAYTMQIYFDFSGYSDMAIGLGKMFGFDLIQNFRWHISLSSWFRDYVYIPLGGNRRGRARQALNIFIVWCLTGFWHGAGWNFIFWGFYYALLLLAEKFVFAKILDKIPRPVRHVLTILLVMIGWVFFSADSLTDAFIILQRMFFVGDFFGGSFTYYFLSYLFPLLIMSMSAFGLFRYVPKVKQPSVRLTIQAVQYLIIFVISVLCLIGDTYNPFLYFRF